MKICTILLSYLIFFPLIFAAGTSPLLDQIFLARCFESLLPSPLAQTCEKSWELFKQVIVGKNSYSFVESDFDVSRKIF